MKVFFFFLSFLAVESIDAVDRLRMARVQHRRPPGRGGGGGEGGGLMKTDHIMDWRKRGMGRRAVGGGLGGGGLQKMDYIRDWRDTNTPSPTEDADGADDGGHE